MKLLNPNHLNNHSVGITLLEKVMITELFYRLKEPRNSIACRLIKNEFIKVFGQKEFDKINEDVKNLTKKV